MSFNFRPRPLTDDEKADLQRKADAEKAWRDAGRRSPEQLKELDEKERARIKEIASRFNDDIERPNRAGIQKTRPTQEKK